jgi:hypothetical protein
VIEGNYEGEQDGNGEEPQRNQRAGGILLHYLQ